MPYASLVNYNHDKSGEMMNRLTKIILGASIVIALAWVGNTDYEHAVQQADTYAYNVCHGYHPDYANRSPKCD
jgi:hypothetical protein